MVVHVLPSLLAVSQRLTPLQFQSLVEPTLRRYYLSYDLPQVFYLLVENMSLLCSKSTVDGRRDALMPMLLKALSVRNIAIQLIALKRLPELVSSQYIEYQSLRHRVLPKLKEIAHIRLAS